MQGALAVVLGIVLGVVGALPSAVLLGWVLKEERHVSVAAGLVSTAISFATLSAALVVVWLVARELVLPFGISEATTFLLIWAVEAWRAWRDAQRSVRPGERKSGGSTK